MEIVTEYAKIELIKKGYNRSIFYTGRVTDLNNGLLKIETEKEETIIIRKDQIEQITEMNRGEDEDYF